MTFDLLLQLLEFTEISIIDNRIKLFLSLSEVRILHF